MASKETLRRRAAEAEGETEHTRLALDTALRLCRRLLMDRENPELWAALQDVTTVECIVCDAGSLPLAIETQELGDV